MVCARPCSGHDCGRDRCPAIAAPTDSALSLIDDACKLGCKGPSGVYIFVGKSGKKYVGQSVDMFRRLKQHIRSDKLQPGTHYNRALTGGKTAREIVEQTIIDELGGIKSVENERNPMGGRRCLLPPRL